MSIFFTTVFICLIAGAAFFLYVQYHIQLRKARGMDRSPGVSLAPKSFVDQAVSANTQWRAVKVQTGLMCCQAAESMRGRVYLVAEAPSFPLKKCESRDCKCRYIYLNDRREGDAAANAASKTAVLSCAGARSCSRSCPSNARGWSVR